MTPGKVQDSKVTTFLGPNTTRGGSVRPHPVLGAFLDRLTESELRRGFRRMNRPPKKKSPPKTHSISILMKAPKGVNNMGWNVWWEEVELWVTSKGREPYLLPPQGLKECVLVPSVNQSLAKQGLIIDRVVWERRELGRPAARLRFFSPHKSCQHSHVQFQKSAGVRLGYVVMQLVIKPAKRVEGRDTGPP